MKKTKVLLILFLTFIISMFPLGYVDAHSVELDPESLIAFPVLISGGKGIINISSAESNYSLYYQAVEISDAIYAQITQVRTTGKTELEEIEKERDALNNERTNLKTTYDQAEKAYTEGKNNGLSETELATLKNNYDTAKANYDQKYTEYISKVNECISKSIEINNKVKELTPMYVESNWVKTTDNSFGVDLKSFSGKKVFVVWAKMVTSDGNTYYDETIYQVAGTKVDEISVKSIILDKTAISIVEGSECTLTPTIEPTDATNKAVTWESSDEKVAKVDDGKVTAISEGKATIKVTTKDGNYSATCEVTVTKKETTTPSADEGKENISANTGDKTNTIDQDNTKKSDNTVVTSTLPKTGSSYIIILAIIVLIILGVISYKKEKYLNIK